jgi:hypothetical protein
MTEAFDPIRRLEGAQYSEQSVSNPPIWKGRARAVRTDDRVPETAVVDA